MITLSIIEDIVYDCLLLYTLYIILHISNYGYYALKNIYNNNYRYDNYACIIVIIVILRICDNLQYICKQDIPRDVSRQIIS